VGEERKVFKANSFQNVSSRFLRKTGLRIIANEFCHQSERSVSPKHFALTVGFKRFGKFIFPADKRSKY
jgi:hypothetical protein